MFILLFFLSSFLPFSLPSFLFLLLSEKIERNPLPKSYPARKAAAAFLLSVLLLWFLGFRALCFFFLLLLFFSVIEIGDLYGFGIGFGFEVQKSKMKMGFSQGNCSQSEEDHPSRNEAKKLKAKAVLRKMVVELGLLGCLVPATRTTTSLSDDDDNNNNKDLEHNKAWLLAEFGGRGSSSSSSSSNININNGLVDPQSVHSSFRFSFCSQVELESMNMNMSMNMNIGNSSNAAAAATATATATVLMVNLENGQTHSHAHSNDLKCRTIQSLEKSISPLANTTTLVRFTYAQIASATRHFSNGRVLGRGALSYVFRGRIGILRTSVAIKRLDKEDKESSKAFCRELMIASSLHHSNVVPLVGFCMDPQGGLFLVYKYVSGGSLERHLHDKKKKGIKGSTTLAWSIRYKVAIGIAQAVAYLHNGTQRCVVHRDIKPSNILLSSNKTPKLCDFGLATWTSAPSAPFLCKTVKGTFGYLAPEYFQHGKVSDKTDIYALGVVLLELITGRKPIEARRPQGEENLVQWAKPLLHEGKGAIEELLDSRLKCTARNSNQIARMIEAAAACITSEEARRPAIGEIIAILKGEQPVLSTRKKSSFPGNGCVIDCYSQSPETNNEMKSHLALAMLGVSELEDDDHFYCR